jgi:hypothetical protein
MTSISLYNRNPLEVSFEHPTTEPPAQPVLTIIDDQGFSCSHLDADGYVFVELPSSSTGLPETTVIVRSPSHDVYVWEQTAVGYSLWPRRSTGICQRTYAAPTDTTVCVQVLAAGNDPPKAPPAPGSGSTTLLKVKVRKSGELPF